MSVPEMGVRPEKRVRVVIKGWVQGVGFRANAATRHSASAWPAGCVTAATAALRPFSQVRRRQWTRWCAGASAAPRSAEVSGIEVTDAPEEPVAARSTSAD